MKIACNALRLVSLCSLFYNPDKIIKTFTGLLLVVLSNKFCKHRALLEISSKHENYVATSTYLAARGCLLITKELDFKKKPT